MTLQDLPVEVISIIIAHIATACDLASLSKTSKRLNRIVEEQEEGWRIFAASRFPSLTQSQPDNSWKEAAHALTTFSRNIDKRAFIGSEVQPRSILFITHGVRHDRYAKPSRQTMGYQAVLDSYEDWPCASGWADRREVVAWGAGADLIMRRSRHGQLARPTSASFDGASSSRKRGWRNSASVWWAYQERLYREGLHDITTVNVLRPPQRSAVNATIQDSEDVLIGRANGDLDLLRLHAGGRQILRSFQTEEGRVKSVDVSSFQTNLVATITGTRTLNLYPLHGPEEAATAPVSSDVAPECNRWSTRFIGDEHVAVGRGPSNMLLQMYAITPTGLSKKPVRSFYAEQERPFATTVYPITPLPASSSDDYNATNVFLTGGYDGRIRLHDLRSPLDVEATVTDPVDRTSVFSLLAMGRERLVAGSAMNSLVKMYDLRMTGGRAYAYLSLQRSAPVLAGVQSQNQPSRWTDGGDIHDSGFNIFTGARRLRRDGSLDAASARQLHSPVYSLSRPSSVSPNLYVGLEGAVHNLNFTSVADEHPDPLFAAHKRYDRSRKFDPYATWWNNRSTALCMSLYEQHGNRNMQVLQQRPPLETGAKGQRDGLIEGYDERIVDVYTERNTPSVGLHGRRGRGGRRGR